MESFFNKVADLLATLKNAYFEELLLETASLKTVEEDSTKSKLRYFIKNSYEMRQPSWMESFTALATVETIVTVWTTLILILQSLEKPSFYMVNQMSY